jgi:hypothetical protein
MIGSFYKRGDFAWVQDVRANYVCIHNGGLAATVVSTAWEPWQVILHRPENQYLVFDARFADPFAAMSRAEELLRGTSGEEVCRLPSLWVTATKLAG